MRGLLCLAPFILAQAAQAMDCAPMPTPREWKMLYSY